MAKVLAAVGLSAVVIVPALGACMQLPSPALRAIDEQSDGNPSQAIKQALAQLVDGTPADRLQGTQIQAILAEANMQLSQPAQVHQAVDIGLALLDQLPESSETLLLRSRLRISEADAALESADAAKSEALLDTLLSGLKSDSLERSCALVSRAQTYAQLNRPDSAASDALTAYRIAENGGWTSAKVAAAYALATVYRRAGLFSQSIAMINEVIAAATANGRQSSLAVGDFTLGRILIDSGRFAEAVSALQSSRELSSGLHDRVGVASADAAICMARIGLGDLDGADLACQLDDVQFKEAHREDLLLIVQGLRAEIQLRRGRAREAIATLDRVLRPESGHLIPYMLPQFYRARSTANNDLRRYREAYSDLKTASEIERNANLAQRAQAVAVLSAAAAADKLVMDNRTLTDRLATQRKELETQRRIRKLWVWLEIITVTLCGLLAYFTLRMRRQRQALKRQETVMRTMASHAPDALVLLDSQRRVRFANRHLFGDEKAHPVSEPLGTDVAGSALTNLTEAMDAVSVDRAPRTFDAAIPDGNGQIRHFELSCVPVIVDSRLIGLTLRSLDVTERHRLEREVIEVAGREQQRLSSDLHEGLGQELTGVMLSLQSAITAIDRRLPNSRALVTEAVDQIADCIKMARDLARGLSPVHNQLGSLPDALRQLAIDASSRLRVGITTSFSQGSMGLSDAASDHLYRIATEALTNAVRHGQCTTIHMDLSSTGKTLQLTITDDGRGPAADFKARDGFGLKLMAYRVRLLGGEMRFDRGSSGGAHVMISIPLPASVPRVDVKL